MFFVRHGTVFFLAYMLLGVGILVAIETPFNEGFTESLKWTAAPILLLSIAFTSRYIRIIQNSTGRSAASIWTLTFLTAGILIFMNWPYALLLNTFSGAENPANIGGQVQKKFANRSRSATFVLVMRSEEFQREVQLTVPEQVYLSTPIGTEYAVFSYVGEFGFFYRWRYATHAPVCRRGAA